MEEQSLDTVHAVESALTAPVHTSHKPLLPMSVEDVVGWLIGCLTLFIAAGGGIGGGGVLVPLYMILMHFSTQFAVALSNLTIAGGAMANIWCNFGRKHPTAERPLIYWDVILVMEPMTIVGAVAGTFLNKLLPIWLTTVALCLLLTILAQKLWKKTIGMYRIESAALALAAEEAPTIPDGVQEDPDCDVHVVDPLLENSSKAIVSRLLDGSSADAVVPDASTPEGVTPVPVLRKARAILLHERRHLPLPTVITLLALFMWLVFSDISKDYVPCGGLLYWALVLSILPVVAVIMSIVRRVLIHKDVIKHQVGIVAEVGDIAWNEHTTILYPLLCSAAGVIAGMFGVGGGIIKGPLMLHLGVLPEIAAATSATMILFTSSSASIVYVAFGDVQWDYAALMMVTGFIFTVFGQMSTYRLIETCGRRSVIVAAMAILLTVGGAIVICELPPILQRALENGFFHSAPICM